MPDRKRYPERYKEFLKYEHYSFNPFLDKLTGIANVKLKGSEGYLVPLTAPDGFPVKVDVEGKEMQVGYKSNGDWTVIDRKQYAKLYIEFIGILMKVGIGLPGVRMLFYILKRLKIGSDVVQFTISSAKAHTGYKNDKSIYEGLSELVKLGVIVRKKGSEEQYYINPQYIFRGKRERIDDNRDDSDDIVISE